MNQPTVFEVFRGAPRITVSQGAMRAPTMNEPLRLHYADDEIVAEVYFFRDQVLHASFNGIEGIRGLAALQLCGLRLETTVGRWPARCTIVSTWSNAVRQAIALQRARPLTIEGDEVGAQPSA